MRTNVTLGRQAVRILACFAVLLLLGVPALCASCFHAGGVSLGVTTTTEEGFDNPSWAGSGTVECFGDRLLQPRFLFGISSLRGDDSLEGADGTYGFATGGIAFGRLVYGTLNAGLYYTYLKEPIIEDTAHKLEFGFNGGVRFLLPMGHNAGIPFDVLYHRVGGPGPDSFWTFTVGIFGWE